MIGNELTQLDTSRFVALGVLGGRLEWASLSAV